jgi:hypothetical protein
MRRICKVTSFFEGRSFRAKRGTDTTKGNADKGKTKSGGKIKLKAKGKKVPPQGKKKARVKRTAKL